MIADDHKLFREGLINLLSDSSNIKVIGHAENGKEIIKKARKFDPDIIIMDIGMPIMTGIEATEILRKELPNIKVIAMSMHSEKHFIKDMLEAGVCGYLLKSCTYEQFIDAIIAVNSGKKYFGEEVTEIIINDYLGDEEEIMKADSKLTERESEILKLFAEGKSSREISELLFVSIKTVGTHKMHILEKLELKTTTDLVKYALKRGIITLE